MKKLFTTGILMCLISLTVKSQVPGFFDLTVTDLEGATTNRAVVKMRAKSSVLPVISTCDPGDEFYVTDIITGMTFGIKWPASSPITNVTVNSSNNTQSGCPVEENTLGGFGIAAGSGVFTEGTIKVKAFLANTTPTPTQTDWGLNEWITICTLNITGGSCTICEDLDIYVVGDAPMTEQNVTLEPVYSFDQTGSNNVIYEATPFNGPLPLDLIAFEAEKFQTQDAKLTWVTANEENTSYFSVQRSFDKKFWTELGTVQAAGYSVEIRNYTFMDEKVYNGRDSRLPVYYRLNMVDLDGKQRFSPIESVIFGNSLTRGNEFTLYPNPAAEGVQVEWDVDEADQPTALEFYDIAGKLIYTHKVGVKATAEYVDFNQTQIHAGVYMVRIMSGETPISHQQLVVGKN